MYWQLSTDKWENPKHFVLFHSLEQRPLEGKYIFWLLPGRGKSVLFVPHLCFISTHIPRVFSSTLFGAKSPYPSLTGLTPPTWWRVKETRRGGGPRRDAVSSRPVPLLIERRVAQSFARHVPF